MVAMEEEIWNDIPGYEGFYQASSLGRIKSVSRLMRNCGSTLSLVKGRIIKQTIAKGEDVYYGFTASRKGIIRREFVHISVAKAFHSNPENKPQVNHKDGDKRNNRKDNVEWATESENAIHSILKGLRKSIKPEQLITAEKIKIIFNLRNEGRTQSYIALQLNTNQSVVSRVLNSKRNYRKRREAILANTPQE